ncbi:MAG: hypothetical protein IKE90_03140 [Bacilli bacterium]|nr:hypothetical protein [Bacilli bacterium]
MKYIYNLELNFKNKYYDFYEWEKNDNIIQFNKIPSYKVSNKDIYNLKNNSIKISKEFLKNKKNIAIFSNKHSVLAIKFDKEGNNKFKSDINIENQEEIINIISKQNYTKLNYKVIKKEKPKFKTRLEIENKNKLIKIINEIYNKKEYDKINYIYLECFDNKKNTIENKLIMIKKEIIKGNDNFYKILNIFKLITQNN